MYERKKMKLPNEYNYEGYYVVNETTGHKIFIADPEKRIIQRAMTLEGQLNKGKHPYFRGVVNK